jgi:hypothetical protein
VTRGAWVALALVACTRAPADTGTLRRGDRAWGTAVVEVAPTLTTWSVAYADGPRAWTGERDADGRLARFFDHPRSVEVHRGADGWTWTASTFGGARGEGRLDLPTAPIWLPGGGPALRAWPLGAHDLLWDGRAAVDAVLDARTEDADGLHLALTAGDDRWTVTLDVRDAPVAVGWPDGTTWRAGDLDAAPPVAAAELAHPTAALAEPGRRHHVVVRLPDGTTRTVDRTLWEELPRAPVGPVGPAGSVGPIPAPTAVPEVLPVDLHLGATGDRKAVVRAAFDAVVAGRSTDDDCKALAWRLAGGLRHAGVDADVVLGLVYAAGRGPAFVHHAWVRVPFGDVALDVDPALGQLVADATHLPTALVGELPPGAAIEVVEAR